MNDLWNDYLTALGYSGSVPDMIVRALRERIEPPPLSGTVNDLWHQYLSNSTGVQHGTIDDLMARHLRGLGYTGAVPDMLRKSLIAGDFFEAAVDKSQLNDALANAAALNEEDYTPNSWQPLEDAVANGEAVAGNPDATQAEVDQAVAEINGAIDALVPRADTEELQGALEDAGELNPSDYTPESWQDLVDTVAAGEAIAADPNATQAQVDQATQAINDAIAALVLEDKNIAYEDPPENFGASFSGSASSIIIKEEISTLDVSYTDDPDFFGASFSGSASAIIIKEEFVA